MTTANQAVKALNQRRGLEAALTNEQLTRIRVERVEKQVASVREALIDVQGTVYRGFTGRLRWLFTGK